MRRLGLRVLAVVLATGGTALAADAPTPRAAAGSIARIQEEIANLESRLAVVRAEVSGQVAEVRYFPIERRLIDADLFFEMKDWDRASTLYRDLVDNPGFFGKPGYTRAMYQLGESLFLQRNFLSARHYYKQLANAASGREFAPAVARLFEIALQTRDFRDVEPFEGLISSGRLGTPEVLYAYGKYLFAALRRTQAAEVMARVPAGSPQYARAQYFLGVHEASTGRLEVALTLFGNAATAPAAADADRDVKGYAALARGRVLYGLGRFQDSLVALQDVDQRSAAFLDSLYDTAWAFYRLNDLRRAANALDVLLMTGPTGELSLRASALRGRILVRMGDQAAAGQTYQEVSDTLGPVATELDRMAADPRSLSRYFEWVMRQGTDDFKVEVPVSERTSKWLQADGDLRSIVGMLQDLLRQREDVREAYEMAERLLWALRSGGRMEAFPALKDRFLSLREFEARFLGAALDVATQATAAVAPRTTGPAAKRLAAAAKAREAAATRFRTAPRTVDDYRKRERKLGGEFQELGRQVFLVESVLRMQRQQVLAIEEWLQEQKISPTGTPLSQMREAGIRAELAATKDALDGLYHEGLRLKDGLEREAVLVHSPERLRGDDEARRALAAALAEESAALAEAAPSDAAAKALAEAAAGLVRRGLAGASLVTPLLASVQEVVDKGAADYELSVLREKGHLDDQLNQVNKAEMDSRAFAELEGARVFRGVRERLGQVLLEADLGLVDMAWQRQQVIADQLKTLGEERADRMKDVGELQKMLKAEEDALAASKAAAEPQPAEAE